MNTLANLRTLQQIPVETPGEDALGDPQHKVSVVANVVTMQWHFARKGQKTTGHRHPHDHQTLLARGAVRCTLEGVSKDFRAPAIIVIRKMKAHQFEALEDDTVFYCVHALRHGDGVDDVMDPADEVSVAYPISMGNL